MPLSLLTFATLVAILWGYLSATKESAPPEWVRAAPSLFEELGAAARSDPSFDSIGESAALPHRKANKTAEPRGARPTPSEIADRLDDASVRLRTGLGEISPVELAAAMADLVGHRYEAAIRKFDRVLKKSPDNVSALAGKSAALTALKRLNEAAEVYKVLVRCAPRDTMNRYNYGVLLCRQSRLGEAAEQFRELVAIDPAHARGHYNLASLAQRSGRLAECREAWEAFLRLEPDTPSAWFNLGIVWMDFERPLDAARCFAIFASLEPEDSDGYINLASALSECRHDQLAEEASEAAQRIQTCDDAGGPDSLEVVPKQTLARGGGSTGT